MNQEDKDIMASMFATLDCLASGCAVIIGLLIVLAFGLAGAVKCGLG